MNEAFDEMSTIAIRKGLANSEFNKTDETEDFHGTCDLADTWTHQTPPLKFSFFWGWIQQAPQQTPKIRAMGMNPADTQQTPTTKLGMDPADTHQTPNT